MQTIEDRRHRSAVMRAVGSRDTRPERIVRGIAAKIAPGYRLYRGDIPGKPDLAWVGRKRAVFVHGCFWHGHNCARGARVPKANRAYWVAKIARNRARDEANTWILRKAGWRILTLWECQLKHKAKVTTRLAAFLTGTRSR
jgi:DNA mismatch endonuclease (patch repair protein)